MTVCTRLIRYLSLIRGLTLYEANAAAQKFYILQWRNWKFTTRKIINLIPKKM